MLEVASDARPRNPCLLAYTCPLIIIGLLGSSRFHLRLTATGAPFSCKFSFLAPETGVPCGCGLLRVRVRACACVRVRQRKIYAALAMKAATLGNVDDIHSATDMFFCRKCKKRKCTYYQVSLRVWGLGFGVQGGTAHATA
jgi:hypothetical protein